MFISNIQSIISSNENIKSIVVSNDDYDKVVAEITNVSVAKHDSHLVFFLDSEGKLLDVHNITR
jgi:hypothetical protein